MKYIESLAGAVIVAAFAAATVITCGGFAAAATAVCLVGSGVAAATTASTIAAAAFIGSATVYGTAVLAAASNSSSIDEFRDQGNWGTVAATAFGGLTGGYNGYTMSKAQAHQTVTNQASQTVTDDELFCQTVSTLNTHRSKALPIRHLQITHIIITLENMKNRRYVMILLEGKP